MNISRQIYYCAVSGALAGLLAWLLVGSIGAARWSNLWLSVCVLGAGLGGPMLVSLTITRGQVERWTFKRIAQDTAPNMAIGMLAGITGLGIGQGVFLLIGGEWAGRVAGWTLLSLLLGLGQAMRDSSPKRIAVGASAGFAAGVACGLVYEALTQVFLADSDIAQMWASCLGLILVGATFAGCIPAAESLVSIAVVVIRSGCNSGLEYLLLDRLTVGSSEACRVMIPDDPAIEPEHVELTANAGIIEVHNRGQSPVILNGLAVEPASRSQCKPGSVLRIGSSDLRIV
jgi:hypothetical protein